MTGCELAGLTVLKTSNEIWKDAKKGK